MSSHDKRYIIERYPNYEDGELISVSFGCPQLGLMGYSSIVELFTTMTLFINQGIEEAPMRKPLKCLKCEKIFENTAEAGHHAKEVQHYEFNLVGTTLMLGFL